MAKAVPPKRRGASRGPVSVALPDDLRARIAREARQRGLKLSSTVRVLVAERIEELAASEALTRAEEWQRAEAWATWDRLRQGDRREVSVDDLDKDFATATRRARRNGA